VESLSISPIVRKDLYILVLMMVTVPLAGELKFYPVNETFRISFGAPTFFFFLLLFQKIPPVFPGFLTGLLVVGFRILIDWSVQGNFDWTSSFHDHYPSFFYYFTYSFLFHFLKVTRFHNRPLIIGCMGMIIEVLSDLIELIMQYLVFQTIITWGALQEIVVIAISHSFIVLSFLNMIKLYEAQSREEHTRKQNEHMLMLISNLYEESIQLKKTLQNAENITIKSYDLYQGLKGFKNVQAPFSVDAFVKQALIIAGEVHEIKKDNQRIFAGLVKLISDDNVPDYMDVHQIVRIIVQTNKKYARLLGKDIEFDSAITGEHSHYYVYAILSIVNNLVSNAVEAIDAEGRISICIKRHGDLVELNISDSGPGISPRRKNLIFRPGFTTKYDHRGNPSTGIGLSYVNEMVGELNGDINVLDGPSGQGTTFVIHLPVDTLIKKE